MSNSNLFDNSMVRAARKGMSAEQKEAYRRIGEQMYSGFDFASKNYGDSSLQEATEYLLCGLRSGLHPSTLTSNEQYILSTTLGDKWYESYGWTKEDLTIHKNELVPPSSIEESR